MSDDQWIRVEVAYALPDRQWLLTVNVPASATLEEALERSRLVAKVPEGLPADARYGIWGKAATAGATLRDGDRIEVYRPLVADPKEARRQRAKRPSDAANSED